MKLYIPTCTLNFNNIFSSESISPASYYQNRGFGNKRFYTVPANNNPDVILLYTAYPSFQLENNDLENYPMVIEIETTDYPTDYFKKVSEYKDVDVYVCPHTIYLNPFHDFVYIDSAEIRQSVMTKAEQSLENKFSKLYSANILVKKRNCIVHATFTNKDFKWSPDFLEFELPSFEPDYKKDVIIDRVKGFLYCYLIGANQSVSSNTGKLKVLAKELRNTLSAVINSPSKRPTQMQDDTLVKDIKEFNEIYSLVDARSINNKRIIESTIKSKLVGPLKIFGVDPCITILKAFGVYEYFCSKIGVKQTYDASELWECLDESSRVTYDIAVSNLLNAVKEIEDKEITAAPKQQLNDLVKIEAGFSVKMVDCSYITSFYERLIQSQIQGDYLDIMNENGVEEPVAQAYNGGKILSTMMRSEWDKSETKIYIKQLLNHFQENTRFDLFSLKNDRNGVMSSFAAFCQKGDSIERLSEYLEQCGIVNYRIGFGIYGATRGFASLPKTFTSVLINGDMNYYKEVYKSIYSMLLGVTLRDVEFYAVCKNYTSYKTDNIIKNDRTFVLTSDKTTITPRAFMEILRCMKNFSRTRAYKELVAADFADNSEAYTAEKLFVRVCAIVGKNIKPQQKELLQIAMNLAKYRDDRMEFSKQFNCNKQLFQQKTIEALFNDEIIDDNGGIQHNLSKIDEATSFIHDKNAWEIFKEFVPDKYRKEVYDRLKWFCDEFAKGVESKYYSKAIQDNYHAIKAFVNHIKNKVDLSEDILKKISDQLHKKYT